MKKVILRYKCEDGVLSTVTFDCRDVQIIGKKYFFLDVLGVEYNNKIFSSQDVIFMNMEVFDETD